MCSRFRATDRPLTAQHSAAFPNRTPTKQRMLGRCFPSARTETDNQNKTHAKKPMLGLSSWTQLLFYLVVEWRGGQAVGEKKVSAMAVGVVCAHAVFLQPAGVHTFLADLELTSKISRAHPPCASLRSGKASRNRSRGPCKATGVDSLQSFVDRYPAPVPVAVCI